MNHIPVPALECPDGVIQIPYFSSQLNTIPKGKLLAGDGIEEFGFGRAG